MAINSDVVLETMVFVLRHFKDKKVLVLRHQALVLRKKSGDFSRLFRIFSFKIMWLTFTINEKHNTKICTNLMTCLLIFLCSLFVEYPFVHVRLPCVYFDRIAETRLHVMTGSLSFGLGIKSLALVLNKRS